MSQVCSGFIRYAVGRDVSVVLKSGDQASIAIAVEGLVGEEGKKM